MSSDLSRCLVSISGNEEQSAMLQGLPTRVRRKSVVAARMGRPRQVDGAFHKTKKILGKGLGKTISDTVLLVNRA